jgi:hypothetical protein
LRFLRFQNRLLISPFWCLHVDLHCYHCGAGSAAAREGRNTESSLWRKSLLQPMKRWVDVPSFFHWKGCSTGLYLETATSTAINNIVMLRNNWSLIYLDDK